MQVFEQEKSYKGMDFKVTHYEAVSSKSEVKTKGMALTEMQMNPAELSEALEEYKKISKALEKRMAETYGEFDEVQKTPRGILSDYGPNEFVLEYSYVNPIGFEGAKIVEAETESGKQAMGLAEHCMNDFKNISGYIPIDVIPFLVSEAKSRGRRCVHLFTSANHPQINEFCAVFIGEK